MKKFLFFFLLALWFTPQQAIAQDDRPWWKNLFKKESVEEIEKEEKQETTLDVDNEKLLEDGASLADSVTIGEPEMIEARALEISDKKGKININSVLSLDSLSEKYKDKDYRGYRIQVYLGDLNLAKQTRANFISKKSSNNCYIEQRAPDYVVLVGDFRDLYEAHQSLFRLKEEFPNAFIVDSEISL